MADLEDMKPLRDLSEAFKELAATVDSQTVDVELAQFARASSLILPLIRSLGIAFKFAEVSYASTVNDLVKASKSIGTLQALVDGDIEANTARKDTSNTRNLLRVKRTLEVVRAMCEQTLARDANSLRDPATKAYTQVFASFHGMAVKKAVAAGLYAMPTRAQMLKKLNEDKYSSAAAHMQSYVATSANCNTVHWKTLPFKRFV